MPHHELFGCGFNAHWQLSFTQDGGAQATGANLPEDIRSPTSLITTTSTGADKTLKPVFVGWSDILLQKDEEVFWYGAGRVREANSAPLNLHGAPASSLSFIGDHTGPLAALSKTGEILLRSGNDFLQAPELGTDWQHIAIAGTGVVCAVKRMSLIPHHSRPPGYANAPPLTHSENYRVFSFPSFSAFINSSHDRIWSIPTLRILQIIANESSFTLLSHEGEVYTWGDSRYDIGREVIPEEPDSEPTIVTALEGLKIVKISAGAWMAGAISNERDLYVWGKASVDDDVEGMSGWEKEGEVSLVDLGEGVDVSDVAVGGGHVVVLTTEGDVYAAGRNKNGQTGTGSKDLFLKRWEKLEKFCPGRVTRVDSGPSAWCTIFEVNRENE